METNIQHRFNVNVWRRVLNDQLAGSIIFPRNLSGSLYLLILTPWLMEPGCSILYSQGLSINPYPEPNQLDSSY